MRVKFALCVLAMQICCMGFAGQQSKASISLTAKLHRQTHNYTLKAGNFADALVRVASEFQIPMGIEWVLTPSATKPVNLSRANATVQQIIEALAKSQPGYEVEIRNRIVHVAPSGLAHRAQNFLDLRVGDFEVRNEAEEMVNRRLYEVANATVSPPKPQSGTAARGIGGSLLGEVGAPNVSVSLRNATVEDVLDALSLASDKRIWVVTFCADKALTPTGFRRTVSLWNNSPIPDSEQPIWDMFEWGRQPPNPLAALRQRDNTCKQH